MHVTYLPIQFTDGVIKTSFNKVKRIDAIQSMFSDQSEIKLEINRMISEKSLNIWKLSNILLNNPQIKNLKKMRKYFKLNKNEEKAHQIRGMLIKRILIKK